MNDTPSLKRINLDDVGTVPAETRLPLFSATHEDIVQGHTTDIYLLRTLAVLEKEGLADTPVVAEVFSRKSGVLAGIDEVMGLLQSLPDKSDGLDVWSLQEGDQFEPKETVLRIAGPYGLFGPYETAILGTLAHSTGWATAARQVVEAAAPKPVISFGARHVHPAVASVMERAAIVGGATGAASVLGARLAGQEPSGTTSHAFMLIIGDTLEAMQAYHRHLHPSSPRIALVDTFKDEAEEALRLVEGLGKSLQGIRIDTPGERGGVTPDLVTEVRARLHQAGHHHVKILVSGGLTPERIQLLADAGADLFGVGSYISGAKPIDMTMDIKEINGVPIAKRGRIPGVTRNDRLARRSL